MADVITDDEARYACHIVQRICTEVGPGMPGTRQEQARGAILARELEMHLGADSVAVERFTVAPWASLSAYPISAILLGVAALLNLSAGRLQGPTAAVTALAALAFAILSPLLYVLEFVLGHEMLDPLFSKRQSKNVVGRMYSR